MSAQKKHQSKVSQTKSQPVANKHLFDTLIKKASQPIQPVQPK